MSDDGYFYDDEGEEFEGDLFWNDDCEILLADDLAEHTLPSPAYFGDAAYETMDRDSDWEYYSDDYYDDDHTMLKNNPQEGSPLQRSKLKRSNGPRGGKKRKLAAISDIPNLSLDQKANDELRVMRPSFKGTIWRSLSPEGNGKKLYQPGTGDRVALLENWREVFKSSQPFGKDRRKLPLGDRKLDHNSTKTTFESTHTEPRPSVNGSHSDATEGVDLEADYAAESRDPKRRRVSSPRDLHGPLCHKVVVEIPPWRVNGTRDKESATQNKPEQPFLSSRKRKMDEVDDGKTNGELFNGRAKRVASGKAPPKKRNNKKATDRKSVV